MDWGVWTGAYGLGDSIVKGLLTMPVVVPLAFFSAGLAGSAARAAGDDGSEVKVTLKGGKLKLKSVDGDFEFALGGRVMADTAMYFDDKSDLGNGSELRRARLRAKGVVWKRWQFEGQYEFAGGDDHIRDAYIGYTGLEPWTLRVGHIKEPFSLENLTSSKYVTFMERALPNAFAPGRAVGILASTRGGNWTLAGGLYSGTDAADSSEGDSAADVAARVTWLFPLAAETNMHVGFAAAYRDYGDDKEARIRQRPESHVTDARLVDTGAFAASDRSLYGLEAALIKGRFSAQGEYIVAHYSGDGDERDRDLDGYYAYVSWFLTPDSRGYSGGRGVFGQVKPASIVGKGGRGAWEAALRYSALDAEAEGGKQNNISLALNWYATPTIRFSMNYVDVLSVDGGPRPRGNEPSLLQFRAQVEF